MHIFPKQKKRINSAFLCLWRSDLLSTSWSLLFESEVHWWQPTLVIFHVVLCWVAQSCLTLFDPMDGSPPGSSVHGDSPGKNTGVGCHALLQGNLPNPGTEPRSPTLQADSLPSELPGKSSKRVYNHKSIFGGNHRWKNLNHKTNPSKRWQERGGKRTQSNWQNKKLPNLKFNNCT